MCSSRRRDVTSGRHELIWIVIVFAVFCHEMSYTDCSTKTKLARANKGKRSKKPAEKKKKVPSYPKNFFPANLYKENGGLYENAEFVFEGHPSELVIPCVPPGQKEPKNKQMYDWRFTDGRGVMNNYRFNVNPKSGDLKISKPDADTDGYYKCNIVMPDESIIAYRHVVMTVFYPVWKNLASISVAIRSKCDDPIVTQILDQQNAANIQRLCQAQMRDDCPYEFVVQKGDKSVELVNVTENKEACTARFNIAQVPRKSYVRKDSCESLECMRNDAFNSIMSTGQVTPSSIFEDIKARHKALGDQGSSSTDTIIPVDFKQVNVGLCDEGYTTHNSIVCIPCEPGTQAKPKSDYTGENYCEKCPEKMYNDKLHQTKCTECPKNKEVNSESIHCIDPKKALGQRDINMARLVADSEEVGVELGKDKWVKSWWARQWEKQGVQVAVVVTANVLVIFIAGVVIWKRCTKKETKYTALGKVEEDATMQSLVFKAAAEVYRKKEIVEDMSAMQRLVYERMSPQEQQKYLDVTYSQEKLKARLKEIKTKPLGGLPEQPKKPKENAGQPQAKVSTFLQK